MGSLIQSVDDDGEVPDGDDACDDDADMVGMRSGARPQDEDDAVADDEDACNDDADVGLLMRSVDDDGKVADGDDACDDDANVIGMGSGMRPWRLPILILPSVAHIN